MSSLKCPCGNPKQSVAHYCNTCTAIHLAENPPERVAVSFTQEELQLMLARIPSAHWNYEDIRQKLKHGIQLLELEATNG